MPVLSVADVEELAADEPSRERFSLLGAGQPLVVACTSGAVDLERVGPFLRRVPTVTVLVASSPDGVTPGLTDAFDVCITEAVDPPSPWAHRGLDALQSIVADHPLAALGLAGHLRSVGELDTWSGLAAESAVYGLLLGGEDFASWLGRRPTRRRPSAAGDRVIVERSGDRLRLTLNRPDAHNAFDSAMRDELVEALQLAFVDTTITGISWSGAGPSFCSGGDLDEFGSVREGPVAHAVRLTRHPGWWVHACRDRLTVRVHGSCIGAGIELPAFAADVEAEPDATFSLPEVAMGLIPGAGGTVSITRRIGRQRTAWLALTRQVIDAPSALRWGLIDRVVAGHG